MTLSTHHEGVRTCDRQHSRGRFQILHPQAAHSSVTNLTVFGQALQRACRSDRFHAILGAHGFFDGGCLSLALALQGRVGPAASIRYVGRPGYLDHAVCAVRLHDETVYLDADGLADARDLKRKMRAVEFAGEEGQRLSLRAASRHRARLAGIDDWNRASQDLARGLGGLFRRHPDPEAWLARIG